MADESVETTQAGPAPDRTAGVIEAIFITAEASTPLHEIDEAEIVTGKGIRGDRYFSGEGKFSSSPGERGLTLIEAEAIENLAGEHGIEIEPHESRRNVLTRGIDLNALVGTTFYVGEIECFGEEPADPCAHLQKLTRAGVLRGLVNRGGVRASVRNSGTIRPGDVVRAG